MKTFKRIAIVVFLLFIINNISYSYTNSNFSIELPSDYETILSHENRYWASNDNYMVMIDISDYNIKECNEDNLNSLIDNDKKSCESAGTEFELLESAITQISNNNYSTMYYIASKSNANTRY